MWINIINREGRGIKAVEVIIINKNNISVRDLGCVYHWRSIRHNKTTAIGWLTPFNRNGGRKKKQGRSDRANDDHHNGDSIEQTTNKNTHAHNPGCRQCRHRYHPRGVILLLRIQSSQLRQCPTCFCQHHRRHRRRQHWWWWLVL